MMIKRMGAVVLAAASLGVAACGDDEDSDSSASSGGGETASAEEASVSFTSPEDGSTQSDSVTAEVELENFELAADEVGMDAAEGQGHLHFSLDEGEFDNSKYSGANGKLAEDLGVDGQYSPSTEPTITYEGLPPGEHTLEVYLAGNDHSDTGVEAETSFTVE